MPNQVYPQQLSGRDIRLLDLLPGETTGNIKGRLTDANLENLPSFEALSYVWGDPNVRISIECNEEEVFVTKNLGAALRRLQRPDSSRLLWVDAICINQSDVEERNKQIQLMQDIYSRAVRVVIWLGPDTGNEVSKAISGMDHIYAACLELSREDMDEIYKAPVFEREPAGNFDPQNIDDWAALGQFFSRPWFFRVWCIQETALALDRLVLCGESEISWDKLHITAEWIDDCQQWEFNMPRRFKEINIRGAISMHRVSKYDMDTTQAPLQELLNRFRDGLATDPRDKVYAVLGLMEWKEEKLPVEINYKKSVCEVYTDVVWAAMQDCKDLSVLSFVSHESDYCTNTTFPSWVPRWDRSPNAQMLWSSQKTWSACADRKLEDFKPAPSGAIGVRGVRFDSVEFTTDTFSDPNGSESSMSAQDILLQLWNECSGIQPTHPQPHTAIITVAKILIAGARWERVSNCSDIKHEKIRYEFLALINKTLEDRGLRSKIVDPSGYLADFHGDWRGYEARYIYTCRNRRIFRTKRGYYGLGPACMQVGDIAVVLFGGRVPYILRSMPTDFAFLGESYIDDIMHGQVFDELGDGQWHEETFVLR